MARRNAVEAGGRIEEGTLVAGVSVRNILRDVEAAIAFHTGLLGSQVARDLAPG